MFFGLITQARLAARMLYASNSSTIASPSRVRQRDKLDGSMGGLVCKYVSPEKIFQ
jgi:hypothetical protein